MKYLKLFFVLCLEYKPVMWAVNKNNTKERIYMEIINKLVESLEKELLGKEFTLEEIDIIVNKELKYNGLDQGSDFPDIRYYGYFFKKTLVLEADKFDFVYEIYYDSGEYESSCEYMNRYNIRLIFKLDNPTLIARKDTQLSKDTLAKVISIEIL